LPASYICATEAVEEDIETDNKPVAAGAPYTFIFPKEVEKS
jgi:hypothetical protein